MPSSSKLPAVAVVGVGAYAASTAFMSVPLAAPARTSVVPAMLQQGLDGSVEGGSEYNVCTLATACTISGVVLAACGALAQKRSTRSAKSRVQALARGAEEEEPAFTPGQKVRILAPPAMAGKLGSVEGPAAGKDAWKVRTESGNVFEFQTQSLQDIAAPASAVATPPAAPAVAAAPAKAGQATDDELEFEPGQKVRIVAPPAMAGKLGSIEGPAAVKDTWKVRTESGNVFEFQTQNLQDISAPVPSVATPPVAAAPAKAGQATDDELEFESGQKVRIVAPPAMAGKLGSIEGPAAVKDIWKVRTESGNVFEFQTDNLQDIAAPAPAVATPPAALATAAAPAKAGQATDDELEFTLGQKVRIVAPPAMAGKLGSVEGPTAVKDTWKVRTESGNVFEFQTQNLHALEPAFA